MATDKMIAEKNGAVGRVIFNNPARHNAVSLEMWEATNEIMEDFLKDDAIRVIVLTGAGGKAFVSGADISKFEDERANKDAVEKYGAAVARAYNAIHHAVKPTIAMIHGYCIGGGLGLAVCCDLRICADNAQFAIPAAKLGLGYGFNNLRKLVEVVGPSFAKEIFFTARRFSAEEARIMGLVNRVVPQAELESYVQGYADTIAANAPLTVVSVNRIINEIMKDPEDRDLAMCEQVVRACFESQDYIEGRQAFMEKRKPAFVGR